MARDSTWNREPSLFAPVAPFAYAPAGRAPWNWRVTDARAVLVATAATRAGARSAVRALYAAGRP